MSTTTDISALLGKIDGDKLSADEFKRLVRAVIDNQAAASLAPGKFGWAVKKSTAGRNAMHFFSDKDAAESWEASPTADNAPLVSVPLPSDGGEAYSYVVKLETNSPRETMTPSRNLSVNIRLTSVVYNGLDQSVADTGEDASVRIQRQVGDGGAWETVCLMDSFASVPSGMGPYTTIDLSGYLVNGEQTLRLIATGNVSGLSTTYLSFSVHVAEMGLKFATNWGRAFVYNEQVPLTHTMTIPLRITGKVHKILFYELYDFGGGKVDEGSIEIGTSEYTETSYQGLLITHPRAVGIYTVRVRLRYGNSTVYTRWEEQNIMTSVNGDKSVLLCVNNVTNPVYNWSTQHLLDYAVYDPASLTGATVGFELLDNEEATSYMTGSNGNAENGVVYDYSPYLGIENSTPNGRVRLFAAKLRVSVGGVSMKTLTYSVDNSNDFAPTAGANFKLMPSGRSNGDADRETIYNESSVVGEPRRIGGVWENVMFEDDGYVSEDGVKMLRLNPGGRLRIPYEVYSDTSQENGLTIEADIRVGNIADEEEPVLRIGKEVDGQFVGMILYPKRGYFLKSVNNVAWFQDVEWQENVRTHITANIVPGLEVKGRQANLVRIFVNGVINREFTFAESDRFWDGEGGGIQIGSDTARVDVFGLTVFKERRLSASDVFNDVVAAKSDVAEKLALIEANSITENGTIKYSLAKEKYNTLVWKGVYPSKQNQAETTGDLEVNIRGDAAHSGVLRGMKCKGQGTSSKRYLKWNGGWSFGHDGVWVDGNGEARGKHYQLTSTSPHAKKLVGKINWASSPQAHKMGMCNMFNALHDAVFDGSAGFERPGIKTLPGYDSTKVAVEEKAFLFFVQEPEDGEPAFYGNMTWGSAKGDGPTFGYDKSHPILKDYLMIEGSDQTPVLGLCQVPWMEDEVLPHHDDDGKVDGWQYGGTLSFDLTLGNAESIGHFKEAFNAVFRYSTRINYYNGRLEELQNDGNADKSYQHFIVGQTYDNFYVYRYDWLLGRWVNAGTTKTGGEPDAVYLPDQLGIELDPSSADFDGMLAKVKAARCAAFRAVAGNWFHVNDMLFVMQFNKINALSDNRNKNTYPYYDPKERLIRNASDDNDTCGPFNNQGQKQKPYWVEEHDYDSRATFNGYYWAAGGNAMYNLFEDAYPNELRTMMRKMMTAMANLGVGYGDGGVMGFYDKHFFSIQRYFPAVAYNECARLWYEHAKTLYDAGEYTNDTDPITQSLGDQLECEKEWVRKRIVYMASYCMHDAAMGGSIEFRQRNSATYALKPAMKMYVYMELGTSYRFPAGHSVPKRCEPGETVNIVCEGSDSIQTYIVGAEYLADLGDLSAVGVGGSTAFANGKRLVRLKAGDKAAANVRFKPDAIVSFPANAKVVDLRNIDTLSSLGANNNLGELTKLEEFHGGGTGLTAVELPQTNRLNAVSLPDGIRNLVLRNQQHINTFSFTPTNLRALVSGNCNVIDQTFIENWVDGMEGGLEGYSLEMDELRWTNFAATRLTKLCGFGRLVLKGKIVMDGNSLTAEQLDTVYGRLGALMDSGELELAYDNVISLSMGKTALVGGEEGSVGDFSISALRDRPLSLEYSDDGTTWLPMGENTRLTMTSRTEVVHGCRHVYGTLVALEEVDSVVTFRVRATDGEQSSRALHMKIIRKTRITGVGVSGPRYLTTPSTDYLYTATPKPDSASEVPTYSWDIGSVANSDMYDLEVSGASSRVVRKGDGMVMAELTNRNARTATLTTGGELMPAKDNDESFTVRCTVRGTYGSEAVSEVGVTGHARFTPRAVQSYDPEEANYNPALVIHLKNNEAVTGAALHEMAFSDGSRGFYMTLEEAARVTNLGEIKNLRRLQDREGYVAESYQGGVLEGSSFYEFKKFDELKNFANVASFDLSGTMLEALTLPPREEIPRLSGLLPTTLKKLRVSEGTLFVHRETLMGLSLQELHLPKTVRTISARDFLNSNVAIGSLYYEGAIEDYAEGMAIRTEARIDKMYCGGRLVTEVAANLIDVHPGVCSGMGSLASVSGTVSNLMPGSFYLCGKLNSITLSDDVESIPNDAFNGCTNLNLDKLPKSLKEIGNTAFRECNNIEEVTLPDTVTSLGIGAFRGCHNLRKVRFPGSLAQIPGDVCNGCDNLVEAIFSATLTEIGQGAFRDCVNLAMTALPPTLTTLKREALKGCRKVSLSSLPSSITTISEEALSGTGCSFSEIPDSVTVLGGQRDLPNITALSYPNTMASPGGFVNCANLRSVYFRKASGDDAFYMKTLPSFAGCPNLAKLGYEGMFRDGCVYVPDSVTAKAGAFSAKAVAGVPMIDTVYVPNVVDYGRTPVVSDSPAPFGFDKLGCNLVVIKGARIENYDANYAILGRFTALKYLVMHNLANMPWSNRADAFTHARYMFFKMQIPPTITAGMAYPPKKMLVPAGLKGAYMSATGYAGYHADNRLIEYDYASDVMGICTAMHSSEVVEGKMPLANCSASLDGGAIIATCSDATLSSAMPIKIRYRIDNGAWSAPANTAATVQVEDGDFVEIYATHPSMGPSNMLRIHYRDGAMATDNSLSMYINPDTDINEDGNYIHETTNPFTP